MTTYRTPAEQKAAEVYADALAALRTARVPADAQDTGGGSMVLYCPLEGARYLMISDVGDPLASRRSAQEGWGVGLYLVDGEPDDPVSYRCTYDTSVDGLMEVVQDSLMKRPDQW